MSTAAIFTTTMALHRRIEAALNSGSPPPLPRRTVLVGPPVRSVTSGFSASLFLFQVDPNRDLRNSEYFVEPEPLGGPAELRNAIPLDLRFLVSVFRTASGDQAEADELRRLGEIIAALENDPFMGDAEVPGQTVRVTLEPASMDDLNRIWAVFPEDSYQPSLIYLATPVYVEAGERRVGPPVQIAENRAGISTEDPRFTAGVPS